MNTILERALFAWLGAVIFPSCLWAQVSPPDLGFVCPAGGRNGTTFEVKLGGQHLDGASDVIVSGDGVTAKIVNFQRPLNQREIGALRRELQTLEDKKDKTSDDRKKMQELRKKIAPPAIRPTPAVAELVTLEVTIEAKARPGVRHLRVVATTGLSNPIAFYVSLLPEYVQHKPLVNPEDPQQPLPPVAVTLPVVLNSQLMPGTFDRYRFPARAGQKLVFIVRARALMPYLADAVPGWFQPALTLFNSTGREVAFADHFHHHPDAVLAYTVPKDEELVLEIKDALYRGREDFVYRIEAGELPFIRSIFPLGGSARTSTVVHLEGWNLPKETLALEPAEMKPGRRMIQVLHNGIASNELPIAVDTLPECTAVGTNTNESKAQRISPPTIVNGRITQPGSWHVFQFEGTAGQVIVAEVRARRLGSPLDSILKLTDSNNKVVAVNDDWEDKREGLLTHHADSVMQVRLPATGVYYLHLGDVQGKASSAHAYRLRLSHPRPNFDLQVTPCNINVRPGSTVALTVHAVRHDGFAGEINLSLANAPKGFVLSAAKIPAQQESVRLTLQVPSSGVEKPIDLVMQGVASVAGELRTRDVTPVDDMMQAFAYHHLVPTQKLMVVISGNARARFPAQLVEKGPVRIRPGGTAQVRIAMARAATANKFQLVLNEPPEGITVKNIAVSNDGIVLHLQADSDKTTPGLKGNLIVEVYPDNAGKAGGARMGQPIGILPAIPFEVTTTGR